MNKYSISEFIGNGKFGEVYKGKKTTGEYVAIKIEKNLYIKLLKHETTILNYLYRKGCKNIPIIYWYGINESFPTLVMSYFERQFTKELFSSSFFSDIISIIEKIHEYGIIHRDIKPSNFMFNDKKINLIDFGFATFYIDYNFQHKTNSINEYIIGTPSYISINIHNGNEASRRDDLISIGYVYLYLNPETENPLLKEYLFTNTEGYDSDLHIKHPFMLEKREGKKWENLSKELSPLSIIFKYLQYCYTLKYDEKPDYKMLRDFFIV